MSRQITTITFFKFTSLASKVWAFTMMQFAHRYISKAQGQTFYKLMGSGRGIGFSLLPDWSVYALLQNWESEKKAHDFFKSESIFLEYMSKASERYTIYCNNIAAHGTWDGTNPFEVSEVANQGNKARLILTRATIKVSKAIRFWKYVPISYLPLKSNKDLVYAKGVGEWPVVQMATLSLWKSEAAMRKFAYASKEHQEAIRKTRELNWYKEELFARFIPYKSVGTWQGKDMLDV